MKVSKLKIFIILLIFFFIFSNYLKKFLSEDLNLSAKKQLEKLSYFFLNDYEKERYFFFKNNRNSIISESKDKDYFFLKKILTRNISNDIIDKIEIYFLPFNNYEENGNKPLGFFFDFKKKLYFITGDGNFYRIFFDKNKTKIVKILKIKSDIENELDMKILNDKGESSIKGVVADNLNNNIYISSTNKKYENCYNLKVIKVSLKSDFFYTKKFFENEDCIKKQARGGARFSILQGAGGYMINLKNEILLSVGEYSDYQKAQDIKSTFGKVLLIDKTTNQVRLISMGHRNIQGMYNDIINNVLIYSEMGPKGGDEININLKPFKGKIKNYGWPISSYGDHYDGKFLEMAPLYKSHSKYGFIEPIKYWNPSISPTKIEKINKYLKEKNSNNIFLLSTLGYKNQTKEGGQSLHMLYFNNDYKELEKIITIPLDERIRDFIFFQNQIIFMLESIPAIGLAKLK